MAKICKFLCLLIVVLFVTDASALTFKKGEKKSFSDCDDPVNRNYQTKDDILADGKWLDKNSEKSLSKIVRNNLEKQLAKIVNKNHKWFEQSENIPNHQTN